MELDGGFWVEFDDEDVAGALDRWRAIWEMRWVDMVLVVGGVGRRVGDDESGGGVEVADVEIGRAVRGWWVLAWARARADCGRVLGG